MNSIKRIRLENFQSHVDTTLDLSDGLNVIVGQSDTGKTAIIRALRWALFNQPRGTDFIHVGANFVRVTVTFSNGVTIKRERTASKNRYMIEEGEQSLVLEGFGTHVPKEVLDAHGMKPLRIDQDTELHLHVSQQLDGPFLLEQTSTTRAKTIGRLSGAHILDMALRDTTRDTMKLMQSIRHHEQDLDTLEKELEPYALLDEAKKHLDTVEEQLASLDKKYEKKKKLREIATQLSVIAKEQHETSEKIDSFAQLEKWQLVCEQLTNKLERYKQLEKLRTYEQELNRSLVLCNEWMKKTVELEVANKEVADNVMKMERLKKLIDLRKERDRYEKEERFERSILQMSHFATETEARRLEQLQKKLVTLSHLKQMSSELERIHFERANAHNVKRAFSTVDERRLEVTHIEELIVKLATTKELAEQYEHLQKRTSEGAVFIAKKEKEEAELEAQYERLLLESKTCPTCGAMLTKETLKRLRAEKRSE